MRSKVCAHNATGLATHEHLVIHRSALAACYRNVQHICPRHAITPRTMPLCFEPLGELRLGEIDKTIAFALASAIGFGIRRNVAWHVTPIVSACEPTFIQFLHEIILFQTGLHIANRHGSDLFRWHHHGLWAVAHFRAQHGRWAVCTCAALTEASWAEVLNQIFNHLVHACLW